MLKPGDLLYLIGRWKNSSIRPEEAVSVAQTDKEHLAASAYRRYQNALKAAGTVDFDDLLLLTEELFTRFPKLRAAEADRFDHLLVDEYQDTNGSQYRIVKALASGHRNLCVVGDDDQSIYGWRGAEVAHILNFQRDWPDAKLVCLEDNYRSTREIIAWANRLIAFNRKRHAKVLRANVEGEIPRILQLEDEAVEARTVVAEIASRVSQFKRRYNDFAILCRTNEQPRVFEMELRRSKVPYVLVGGMSFYDRKEVRDVLAYLKTVANPRDEVSTLRIINNPPRGIGQGTVKTLLEKATGQGKPLWDVLGESGPEAVTRFRDLIGRYRRRSHQDPLVEVVRALIHEIGYRQEIVRLYPAVEDQESRWQAVEEVVNALGSYAEAGQPAHDFRVLAGSRAGDRRPGPRQGIEIGTRRGRADDAALSQGTGVFRGLYGWHGGRHAAPRAFGGRRRVGHRRRAATVLRRRHPGAASADVDAGPQPAKMG